MNEEVMKFYKENKVNPAASCLPLLFQIPIFFSLYYVLKDFEKDVFPNYPKSDLGWLGVVPQITDIVTSHWSGYALLVVYVGSHARLDVLHVRLDGPAAEEHALRLLRDAVRVHPLRRPFPDRPRALLVDHEPVDGRPGARRRGGSSRGLSRRRNARRGRRRRRRPSRLPPQAAAASGDAKPAGGGQQRVRRRKKKKGPRARR